LNVQNKLAALIALAKRPDRRATLDELRSDMAVVQADATFESVSQQYSFDHIDAFESGLVVADGDSLVLTKNGRALLRALGIVEHDPQDLDTLATVHSLNLIDDLIGAEAHRKIFEGSSRPADQAETAAPDTPSPRGVESETHPAHPGESKTAPAPRVAGDPSAAPSFLTGKFGAGLKGPPSRVGFRARIGALMQRGGKAWRTHLQKEQPRPAVVARSSTSGGRIVFALLSLLVFASAACAMIALVQVRNSSAEIAALQRELRERLARLELLERGKQMADKAAILTRPSAVENRLLEQPLVLSREETMFVRDYIKPAPIPGGASLPLIAVGDPVTGPTLPFPSAVTEKVPKLLGSRFTIRNGLIVIVSKDGRRADAVIGQN
jgi:hypothetical protein